MLCVITKWDWVCILKEICWIYSVQHFFFNLICKIVFGPIQRLLIIVVNFSRKFEFICLTIFSLYKRSIVVVFQKPCNFLYPNVPQITWFISMFYKLFFSWKFNKSETLQHLKNLQKTFGTSKLSSKLPFQFCYPLWKHIKLNNHFCTVSSFLY